MQGLKLREEFRGKRLRGTAIELSNEKQTGATQIPASQFLEITYPTADVLKALEAIGPNQGHPLVLLGDRGQGKSHLLGMLFHALSSPTPTQDWLNHWAGLLKQPPLASLPMRAPLAVISESLHRHQFKYLWDLLLDRHPHGQFIRGKWEALKDKQTDVLPAALVVEMLEKQPVALLLDEFQTWFDGLKDTKQAPMKVWAFNFIQVLSEIAKERPELLVLVVSVRTGTSDAYQQIHRVGPVLVDFKGPHAQRDRRRLLLHRLFENRLQVADTEIEKTIQAHASEYLRLRHVPPAEHQRMSQEFNESWPFAPHLMQLLEDQVLIATEAQETRDLIRILVDIYKGRAKDSPILTAADFRLDDDASGIAALLESVANEHHRALREKALRNLQAVQEAVPAYRIALPHLSEIIGALWLRSIAVGNLAGAEPGVLHVDITRARPVDDNAFDVELATIVENSFNIHQTGDRLVFREEENPQAKLMSHARNNRLFTDGADHRQLAREVRYVLGGGDDVPRDYRVIVLPHEWQFHPWTALEEAERPDKWDERLPYVVLPEAPANLDKVLGPWLKDHVPHRRNTIRFLLPKSETPNVYIDRNLIVLARAVLKAQEWRTQSPEYAKLQTKFQAELREILKQRFDRFAVIRTWNFADPDRCSFQTESLKVHGQRSIDSVEKCLSEDVFVPEDFDELVKAAAQDNASVAKLLQELREPRPKEADCIPWLGETLMKERMLRLCARGEIAIDVRGTEFLQASPGEDEETAWRRMRSRLGSGRHLEETRLLLPQGVPHTHRVTPDPTTATLPSGGPPGGVPVDPIATPQPPPTDPPTGGASIFGPPPPGSAVPLSSPATSAINLIGKIESWGIGPATTVREVKLRVGRASGAQLQKLLKTLPDGVIYELELIKDE